MKVLAVLLILTGIIFLVAKQKKSHDSEEADAEAEEDTKDAVSNIEYQKNKVVNVTLTGGIIGVFLVSPLNSLNNVIKRENAAGWKVVQVIPAESGNIFLIIFRLFLLLITIFLYTSANGYYVVLERNQELNSSPKN